MRTLTNPITDLNTEEQLIADVRYVLKRDPQGNIDESKSYFQYIIINYPSETQTVTKIRMEDWHPSFTALLRAVQNRIYSDAEAAGQIHPGNDVGDI